MKLGEIEENDGEGRKPQGDDTEQGLAQEPGEQN